MSAMNDPRVGGLRRRLRSRDPRAAWAEFLDLYSEYLSTKDNALRVKVEDVARKIRELASHHQVFCITHLPQIAARGHLHFQVVKDVVDGRTLSKVVPLTRPQRVRELARMLAGESVSGHTEAWAEELLSKGEAAA